MTRKASELLICARAEVLCFSTEDRLQLIYPRPPIIVMTVFGASILFGWSFHRTTCVVVVVKVVNAPPVAALLVVVDVIEAGPELVGGGEDTVLLPPLDWKEALRLTLGEGRSEPASLELVVWLEELRDSTLQEDISNDRGLEVFIRTLLSNVDTLKRRILLLQDSVLLLLESCNINAT